MAGASKLREQRAFIAARHKARHFAVQALFQWDMAGNLLSDIEQHFREDFDFSGADEAYFCEMLHRVAAQADALDQQYSPLLDRRVDELGTVERALLRMSTYELMHRADVPFKVVIDEAVSLAKKFGATDSHKYINGVLDGLARQLRAAETGAG